MAFGGSKPKKSGASQKIVISSGKVENSVNSADWKKRDKEFIEGTFENELKEALLASKVEFEENQELKDLNTNESENEIPLSKKKTGNKKGTTTMSLDQFNHVSPEVLMLFILIIKICCLFVLKNSLASKERGQICQAYPKSRGCSLF